MKVEMATVEMGTMTPTRETTKETTKTPDRRKRGIPNRDPNPSEKPKPKAKCRNITYRISCS